MFPRWVTWCGRLGSTILAMRGMPTSYRGSPCLQEQTMGSVPLRPGPPSAAPLARALELHDPAKMSLTSSGPSRCHLPLFEEFLTECVAFVRIPKPADFPECRIPAQSIPLTLYAPQTFLHRHVPLMESILPKVADLHDPLLNHLPDEFDRGLSAPLRPGAANSFNQPVNPLQIDPAENPAPHK
jgi:hypothetical protein